MTYTLIQNLAGAVTPPESGRVSRIVYQDDYLKCVAFALAAGEEMPEHSAPMAATITIISGEARLTLGGEAHEVGPGALAHMPAQLPHAILARTPVVFLLQLTKQAR